MKQHPIIFSAESVKAILRGHKTQTRRVINPQPKLANMGLLRNAVYSPGNLLWVKETFAEMDEFELGYKRDPFVIIGYKADKSVIDLSTGSEFNTEHWNWEHKSIKWKSPLYMPKDAARLFLKIKDVRVQKLQDISKEDIEKEGIKVPVSTDKKALIEVTGKYAAIKYLKIFENIKDPYEKYLRVYFASHWDKLNAKRGFSWESNPYAWVIEFERVENND